MLRLSKLADYGALMMTELARTPEQLRTATDLAEQLPIGSATIAKVLKTLSKAGLLDSVRGQAGGYRLARVPEQISVAEIIAAMDGPIALTECSLQDSHCEIEHDCQVRPHWQMVSVSIQQTLSQLSLADMLQPTVLPTSPAAAPIKDMRAA